MAAPELVHVRTLGPHLLLDFVQVIEIVGKGRINIRESNRGHVGDDLVGVIPWCSCHATTSSTPTRWPAMQAFPPQTPGVLVIRSSAAVDMTQVYSAIICHENFLYV